MRVIIGLCLLVVLGCKRSEILVDGKYVKNIKQNTVYFEDGAKKSLNTDKGSKVIYLVRHAEKDTLPTRKNPYLTEAGYERSYKLANIFKETRVDAVYSTFYNRTIHTVDSLTSMKGLSTEIYLPEEMKAEVDEILSDEKLNSVVISGHSNTTPAMAGVFMGEKVFESGFDHDDYDNLIVVNILADGTKRLYKLRYK